MTNEQNKTDAPDDPHEQLEEVALQQAYLCARCGRALDDREDIWSIGHGASVREVLCKECFLQAADSLMGKSNHG